MHHAVVLIAAVLACTLALAIAAPSAGPELDSLLPEGALSLKHGAAARGHAHAHAPAAIHAKRDYAPARVQAEHPRRHTQEPGAGTKVDWHHSVYRGVDRADFIDAFTPGQIRLAFVPNGMSVSFSIGAKQTSAPQVKYGFSADAMNLTASFTEESTYGTLYFYTAVMPNLKPNTRYYYNIAGSVPVYSFVSARAVGDADPFSVIIVGDMGLDNSANTMAQMNKALNTTDFFLHIGDLSYADDFYLRPNDTYEGSWDKWQDLMEPITATSAYMSLPGNHEVTCSEVTPFLCPTYQRNMTAYRNRFRMPWRESGGVQNLWYSFDYGLVHFIQIDTETDYPNAPMGPGTFYNAGPFGDQMSWLEADLAKAAANRAQQPWIVVSGHRPLWSSGHTEKQCIDAFEALFLKYDVDIYNAGHVHWYERTYPTGAGGVPTSTNYNQPTGVVYIINGAAGNVEGLTGASAPQPYSGLIDDSDFGYGKLRVYNATTIQWQYFRATDASIVDDITIVKKH